MNLLLFILLIPLSFADAKFCSDLGRVLSDYEKDLQKSTIKNPKCSDIKVADLIQGHPGLSADGYLEERKCHSLSSIESELERLKAELSVANGIQKLKTVIDQAQEEAGRGSREAGLTFVSSLNAAQSLEILLNSDTFENVPFLQKIKEYPAEKRTNQLDLSNIIKELCAQKAANDDNACNPNLFKPNPDAVNEIFALIESTEVNTIQVEKWKSMLAIQKVEDEGSEPTPWSFTQMQREVEGAFAAIDNNQIMSREHLNAIKRLDRFKTPPGLSFVEDLAAIKDIKKTKIASDKFFVLMGDAKMRQQYEAQSKLSIAWENHKGLMDSLSPEKKESCLKAKALYTEAKACLAYMKEAAGSHSDAELKNNLLPSIEASIKYADHLGEAENKCRTELERTSLMSESCYAELQREPAELQQKIRQLNILKDKIGSENQDLMVWRNFALKKWADKCGVVQTPMDQCELESDVALSKDALLAVRDSLDIAVVFTPKPEAEAQAKEFCEDDEKKKGPAEKLLCDQFKNTPVAIVTDNAPKKIDTYVSPDNTDHRDLVNRDRMINAGTNLLRDVMGSIMNYKFQTPTGVYPYPYNYTPYNYGNPPMGIADSIMFNARYYGGYGFYMPTPGYQPYTAFGAKSPISAYKPISSMTVGTYFGK